MRIHRDRVGVQNDAWSTKGVLLVAVGCLCSTLVLIGGNDSTQSVETATRRKILDLVIADILLNSDLNWDRDFYGMPEDLRFALVTDSPVAWPRGYVPSIMGYEVLFRRESPQIEEMGNSLRRHLQVDLPIPEPSGRGYDDPRLLGIRLDKFNPDYEADEPNIFRFEAQIVVTIFNVGGHANEVMHIGGTTYWYRVVRSGSSIEVVRVFGIS